MPVDHKYGTAGATGGGFASYGGWQPWFLEETNLVRPDYCWQRRTSKTWKDRNQWYSLWSFGCRVSGDGTLGYAPAGGGQGLADKDLFEPYSCDGEGTQSRNFLRGTCKDAGGTPVANAEVQAFRTSDDSFQGSDFSCGDGTYGVGVQQPTSVQHYLVAYKAGTPDISGTTVNTLLPTNVDGT